MTSPGIQAILPKLHALYGAMLDDDLRARVTGREGQLPFYGMMAYQLGYVNERFEEDRVYGGKRFRPLLCIASCVAAGGDAASAVTAATSIELLHNFSLIHDDIEDRDPSRRHRPTVWKVWGEPQAINAGDGMFALAGRLMLDATREPRTSAQLARGFQDTCLALTEGQYMDMSFESRQDVGTDEYVDMISKKTGSLIAFSLWSGALIACAEEVTLAGLAAFGSDLGKAFQIRDDIMGIWGHETTTGKEAARDLYNRKKTLPLLCALERAEPLQRKQLLSFLVGDHDDIDVVLAVLADTSARQWAEERAHTYLETALLSLRSTSIAEPAADELETLAYELTLQ